MKRLHVHVAVNDLQHNIHFYSSLFNSEPTVQKEDYAKWMLDDPRVNFSISNRSNKTGLDHLGIQAEDGDELAELKQNIEKADAPIKTEEGTACCYAKSDKHWTLDPQGIAWETFHSMGEIPTFNEAKPATEQEKSSACCAPATPVDSKSSCC